MTIIRTTTPEQILEFDEGTFDDAVEVWVMYKQRAYKFTKKWFGNDDVRTDTGVDITDDVITVTFTQEETKGFRSALRGHVMVKWITTSGRVISSEDCPFDVGEIWDDNTMEMSVSGGDSSENESE